MNECQKKQPQEVKYCTKDRLIGKIPDYCLQQLEEIKKDLNFWFDFMDMQLIGYTI